jgi:hypothetical protein
MPADLEVKRPPLRNAAEPGSGCSHLGPEDPHPQAATTRVRSGSESLEDRRAPGEQAARDPPVSAHTTWRPATDRADPVQLLTVQDATCEADLVPVRHGRMMVSPFTFYREVGAPPRKGRTTAGRKVVLG